MFDAKSFGSLKVAKYHFLSDHWPFGATLGCHTVSRKVKNRSKSAHHPAPENFHVALLFIFLATQWHPATRFQKRYLEGKYKAFTKVTSLN